MIFKQIACLTLIGILTSCTLYENKARECFNEKAAAYASGSITADNECGLVEVSASSCPASMTESDGRVLALRDEQTQSLFCQFESPRPSLRISCLWHYPRSLIHQGIAPQELRIVESKASSLILQTVTEFGTQLRVQTEGRDHLFNYCVVQNNSLNDVTDEGLELLANEALDLLHYRP